MNRRIFSAAFLYLLMAGQAPAHAAGPLGLQSSRFLQPTASSSPLRLMAKATHCLFMCP
jgi:hypothetical protein